MNSRLAGLDGAPGAGILVGSFQLQRPLAQGGMGAVWLAKHRSGTPAAVKIIAGDRTQDTGAVSAMQAEIRSVGALDHPNIVRVYDAGILEDHHERSSRGLLQAGSPWLAMELATGPISDLADRFDWSIVSTLLLQILDGLAHAHARGIIHRDLKPANLLYVRSTELRAVIADFGLAWQRRQTDPTHGGSLPYAAPEQILGRQAEQGPGTDLYSLGCAVYRLVCGVRPFPERDPEAIGRAHLLAPIPKIAPLFPVSPDLDSWLAGMLAKDPRDRFRCAADAAWALLHLAPPLESSTSEADTEDSGQMTTRSIRLSLGLSAGASEPSTSPSHPWGTPEATHEAREAPQVRPRIPDDWARPRDARAPVGRGLGVFGLRAPPMVGRTAERDLLWDLLKGLRTTRLVALKGGAGLGKSRLAEWFAERAYEVGGAEVLRASFRRPLGGIAEDDLWPWQTPVSGIAQMIEEHLGVRSLSPEELLEHLDGRLAPGVDAARIVRMLHPRAALGPAVDLGERSDIAARLIAARARARAVVVWLDDVHFGGEEPLALVKRVAQAGNPVLFIATARDLPAELDTAWHLLIEHMEGFAIALSPLASPDLTNLVTRMLPIDAEHAGEIARLAGGSPLVAVDIISHLAERGELRGDPGGLALASLETLEESLRVRWNNALTRLEGEGLPSARIALQIAATLGMTFAHSEWRDVTRRLGLSAAPGVLEMLTNRSFLAPAHAESADLGGRSTFAHASLRALLLAEARSKGPAIDLACAEVLAARGAPFAARAAVHWDSAGEHARAAEAYLRSMGWLAGVDPQRASTLSGRWHRSLARERDPERQDLLWERGVAVLAKLGPKEAVARGQAAEALLADAQRPPPDLRAEVHALIELSRVDLRALQLDRALARVKLALHRAKGLSGPQGAPLEPIAVRAALQSAEARRISGDIAACEEILASLLPGIGGADHHRALVIMAKALLDDDRAEIARGALETALPGAQGPVRIDLMRQLVAALGALGRANEGLALFEEIRALRAREPLAIPDLCLDVEHGETLIAADQLHRAHSALSPLTSKLDRAQDAALFARVHAALAVIATRAPARAAHDRLRANIAAISDLARPGQHRSTLRHLAAIERWAEAHGREDLALELKNWISSARSNEEAGRGEHGGIGRNQIGV